MKVRKLYKKRNLELLIIFCAVGFVGTLTFSSILPVQAADTLTDVSVKDTKDTTSSDNGYVKIDKYELVGSPQLDYSFNFRTFLIEKFNVSGKVNVTTSAGTFTYDYSGALGSEVSGTIVKDDAGNYKKAPLIKIKIPSIIDVESSSGYSLGFPIGIFSESADVYKYNGNNFTKTDDKIAPTNEYNKYAKYIGISNGEYYFCLDEKVPVNWIKEGDLVSINANFVLPTPNNILTGSSEGNYVSLAEDGREVASKDKITADVTIDSSLGNEVAKDVTGKIGDTAVSVNVPEVSGYTADKKTVLATATRDGITVNPDQKVTYTKNQTHSNGGTTSSGETNIGYGYLEQTISTHPNQSAVKLYKFENNSLTEISNRALAPNSNWFTDQMLNFNGKRYYRVATNEWAEASDAYVYEKDSDTYKTTKLTSLVNSKNEPVKNRALAANTNWKVDRVAYLGSYKDPIKAYRVATNEFVIADK